MFHEREREKFNQTFILQKTSAISATSAKPHSACLNVIGGFIKKSAKSRQPLLQVGCFVKNQQSAATDDGGGAKSASECPKMDRPRFAEKSAGLTDEHAPKNGETRAGEDEGEISRVTPLKTSLPNSATGLIFSPMAQPTTRRFNRPREVGKSSNQFFPISNTLKSASHRRLSRSGENGEKFSYTSWCGCKKKRKSLKNFSRFFFLKRFGVIGNAFPFFPISNEVSIMTPFIPFRSGEKFIGQFFPNSIFPNSNDSTAEKFLQRLNRRRDDCADHDEPPRYMRRSRRRRSRQGTFSLKEQRGARDRRHASRQ